MGWNVSRAIQIYDAAPILSPRSVDMPDSVIVCSPLRRSHDTALAMFGRVDHILPLMREAELPGSPIGFFPLPLNVWFVIMRILWLLGYHPNVEGAHAFRFRAAKAADCLIEMTGSQDHVILVGHGILNRAIAQEFRKRRVLNLGGSASKFGQHMSFLTN